MSLGKILIVDDIRTERLIMGRLLDQLGYSHVAADNGWDALAKLQTESFDLMLLDLSMPEIDGLEVLRQLRENVHQRDLPVLVMSSTTSSSLAARCVELGAEDYLTKPVDVAMLTVRLKASLERQRLRRVQAHQLEQLQQLRDNLEQANQELKGANLSLQQMAFSDPLTGLPNRRATMDAFQQMWALHQRSGRPLSVLMADVDHFKQVNDVFGHGVGDYVLKQVASQMQSLLRAGDVVGRYGGEEFLILCPDTDAEGAKALGERLRQGVQDLSLDFQNYHSHVTISLGVGQAGSSTPTKEELIDRADRALYQAKGSGRNRVLIYRGESQEPAPRPREFQASEIPLRPLESQQRLRLLAESKLMDSPPEEVFDRFTRLATRLLQAPCSLMSLVSTERQFFKSQVGLRSPWAERRQTPLSHSFCQYVVDQGQPLNIACSREDERVRGNGAIEDLGVESYLGVPLQVEGQNLGSFCVIDVVRRDWTAEEQTTLEDLASAVSAEVELRLSLQRQQLLAQAFQQAKEAAETANRAKSEFLASASHELRTPLNGIIGMCELIRGTPLTREQLEYMQLMRVSADSLLELVNDVLDLAKIEAGHFELRPVPLVAREALAQWLKPLSMGCALEGLDLVLDVDLTVPHELRVDASRLRQILVNLVGNALKFTPNGCIAVSVRFEEGQLKVVVRDTGCGIPQDRLRSIFEAFSQVPTPGVRKQGGTGLGLSIVRRLVLLLGGDIECRSQMGQGTEFEFHLPVETLAATPPKSMPQTAVAWIPKPEQARAFQHLLESLGLKIRLVDQEEAWLAAAFECSTAFLLVSSHDLPALDLLRRLRLAPGGANPRVVALSLPGWEPSPAWNQARVDGRLALPVGADEVLALFEDPSPSAEVASAAAQGFQILVLEDNRVNQKVIRTMLERLGHQVSLTDSGSEALGWLKGTNRFDLALVDLEMPEMSGLEFTRLARQLPEAKELPLVALTARAFAEDRSQCLEAGMNGYLSKPITLSALNQVLQELQLVPSPH